MKTDDYIDQKDESMKLGDDGALIKVQDVSVVRNLEGSYMIRISIGDHMYFDSPDTPSINTAMTIYKNIKNRLQ